MGVRDWKYRESEKGKTTAREYRKKNAKRIAAYMKEYHQTEKGFAVRKASVRKYQQTERGRKIKQAMTRNHYYLKITNGTGVDTIQWEDIIRKYNYRCAYCGKRCALTQDHVIPVNKGGEHSPCNIVPACSECNSRKGTKLWKPKIFRKLA